MINRSSIVFALLIFIIFQCCTESKKTVTDTQQIEINTTQQPPVEKIKLGDSLRLTLKISAGGWLYSIRIRNNTITCLKYTYREDTDEYFIKKEIRLQQNSIDSLKKWITETDDRYHLYLYYSYDTYMATLDIDREIIYIDDVFYIRDNKIYTESPSLNKIINFMIDNSPIEIILPDLGP